MPEGAFKAHPPMPEDTVKSVAVTYRFAVPSTMLNVVAGAIGRSIFKAKAKLMAATPLASQIEAPDPDDKNPVLPVHPGVAAYLASGDQSFLDAAQQYFYIVGIPLSLIASLMAVLIGLWRNKKLQSDQEKILRLLVIADEALSVDNAGLEALEQELHTIVSSCVTRLVDGSNSENHWPVSLAIDHARRSIEERKADLTLLAKRDEKVPVS